MPIKPSTGTLFSNGLLLLTAFIWGSAFVAQSVGMDYVGPFTFNGIRSLIGALALLPVIVFTDRITGKQRRAPRSTRERRTLYIGGLLCGLVLFCATSLQQFGITETTAGKAGFITAMYIVLVPLAGLFVKKKPPLRVWGAVILGLVGLYLLSITEQLTISRGDGLVLLGTFFFSAHILLIAHFAPQVDGVRLSLLQFLVVGTVSLLSMLLFETPQLSAILSAWPSILYAGVLSSGVAYTLQIIAQRRADPTVASLLMSLEAVFAALCGALILGETLSGRELSGCVLLFVAVVLAGLPARRTKSKQNL